MPVEPTQRATEHGFVRRVVLAWGRLGLGRRVAQVGVAAMLVLGLLATASATRIEREAEVAAESGEDGEAAAEQVNVASTSRRLGATLGARARELSDPCAPRALLPRTRSPARRSYLRPRRTAPNDDDDDLESA